MQIDAQCSHSCSTKQLTQKNIFKKLTTVRKKNLTSKITERQFLFFFFFPGNKMEQKLVLSSITAAAACLAQPCLKDVRGDFFFQHVRFLGLGEIEWRGYWVCL